MFKRRVGGIYFAIITQAVAAILTILIVGQQGYTGGINGMTDLRTLQGLGHPAPTTPRSSSTSSSVVLLFGCILHRAVHPPLKLGRILVAMRDQEDRVRFSGYRRRQLQDLRLLRRPPCFAAHRRRDVRAAGRLHVAVLRRHRAVDRDGDLHRGRRPAFDPVGAVYGTLLVNFAQDQPFGDLSRSSGCSAWADCSSRVVLAFPNGLAGIWSDYVQPRSTG